MIRIPNWQKFQHYKNRRPPWIKLYRDLLDKREWRELSGEAAKLLVDCWMLASEGKEPGMINMTATDLAWRLRMDAALATGLLNELEQADLIEREERDASTLRAVR